MLTSMADTTFYESLFPKMAAILIHGVLNSVELRYTPKDLSYKQAMQTTIDTLVSIVLFEEEGNVLAFLSCDQDFNHFLSVLRTKLSYCYESLGPIPVTFIYSDYVSRIFCTEQEVLNAKNTTKPPRNIFLISTVCEFHILNNIRFVVDSGWEMRRIWDPNLLHQVYAPARVSQYESNIRALLAGTRDGGRCYRIFSKSTYSQSMPAAKLSELTYRDLSKPLLYMAKLGQDITSLQMSQRVNMSNYAAATKYLKQLGALDQTGRMTPTGQFVLGLCVTPGLGKVVYEASKLPVCMKVLDLVAVLACPGIFPRNPTEPLQERVAFCKQGIKRGARREVSIEGKFYSAY